MSPVVIILDYVQYLTKSTLSVGLDRRMGTRSGNVVTRRCLIDPVVAGLGRRALCKRPQSV